MDIEKLDPGPQEKVKACRSAEEVHALAKEAGYELSDERLEGVSGGWGGGCDDHSQCGVPYWR